MVAGHMQYKLTKCRRTIKMHRQALSKMQPTAHSLPSTILHHWYHWQNFTKKIKKFLESDADNKKSKCIFPEV